MRNQSKIFIAVLTIAFHFSFYAKADGVPATPACDVPICDIPAEIAMLREASQNTRFRTVNNLKKEYAKSEDAKILENLHQFGLAAAELFIELKEEDWVITEAKQLASLAITALSQFERPINSEHLIAWYKEFANEDLRFNITRYWLKESENLTSIEELGELIRFAAAARAYSISINDTAWVPEQAERLATQATSVLVKLNPYHEGLYRVRLECAPPEAGYAIVACNPTVLSSLDQMTVLNGMQTGIVVDFSSSRDQFVGFHFSAVVFQAGASILRGTSQVDPAVRRYFEVRIDPNTYEVSGTITDSTTMSNYRFRGSALANLGSYLSSKPPRKLSASELVGVYQGQIADLRGKLIVRQIDEKTMAATFIDDRKPSLSMERTFSIDFQEANWQPEVGVLSLITTLHRGGTVKLLLVYRNENRNGNLILEGFHYGGNIGGANRARFVKLPSSPPTQSRRK